MEMFIANPVEEVAKGLFKTRVVSILFDKDKWKNKLDDIKKWVKSRFYVREPKILTGRTAGYYHVRVSREHKAYQKRIIPFSKKEGIKAIIELVPVNVVDVYNYAGEDVGSNTLDNSHDVSYNIKVSENILNTIREMSQDELSAGAIRKIVKRKHGMDISESTIRRYLRGFRNSEVSCEIKSKKKVKRIKKGKKTVKKAVNHKVAHKRHYTKKKTSVDTNEVSALIPFDKNGLMSVAKIGDRLFVILNNTGRKIGEIIYESGKCLLKSRSKKVPIKSGGLVTKVKKLLGGAI